MYFDTKRFKWLTLFLLSCFGAGLWRLQEADFACHIIKQSFFECYGTRMMFIILVTMSTFILFSAYGSGWLGKWPAQFFGIEPEDKG